MGHGRKVIDLGSEMIGYSSEIDEWLLEEMD